MRFSSGAVLFTLLASLALAGCAHAPRAREARVPPPGAAPPAAGVAGGTPPAAAPAPETPRVQAAPPEAAPVPEPAPPAPAQGRRDPTEEITPEELATIPDPVPSRSGASPPPASPTQPEAAPGATAGGSMSTPSPGDSASPAPSQAVWRVQIHASESRDEADRVGREAAARLGVPYALVQEGGLYKVRLGAFATDVEAGALRERAVRAGYAGAFRIREGP